MKKTLYLLTMRWAGLACQGMVTLYLASVLSEEAVGRYGLFVGFITLAQLLCESGLADVAARTGAFRDQTDFPRLIGLVAISSIPIYLIYLLALLVLSAGANLLDKVYFENAVRPALFLAPCVLLHYGLCQICVAGNRIALLGILRFLPHFLSLLSCFMLSGMGRLTYGTAAVCFTAGFCFAVVVGFLALRPQFNELWEMLREARKHVKYGRDMYLSRIIAMGVYKLDVPLLALFLDFQAVAYYTLARALLTPFSMITQSYTATRYKQYLTSGEIPRSDLRRVSLISCASGLVPFIIATTLLPRFFPDKPIQFFGILQILSFRVIIQSISSVYNMYFVATGQTKIVRRISILTALLNLLLYLTMIPVFGIIGVALADTLDCGAYLAMLLKEYCRPPEVDVEHRQKLSDKPIGERVSVPTLHKQQTV